MILFLFIVCTTNTSLSVLMFFRILSNDFVSVFLNELSVCSCWCCCCCCRSSSSLWQLIFIHGFDDLWFVIVVLPMTLANRFDSIFSQWFAHENRSPAALCVLKFCDRQRCTRVLSFYCKLYDSRAPIWKNVKSNNQMNIFEYSLRFLSCNKSQTHHKFIPFGAQNNCICVGYCIVCIIEYFNGFSYILGVFGHTRMR